MDVHETVVPCERRQAHFGEVHRKARGTVVAVLNELVRHFFPDIRLRFHGAPPDVRREENVLKVTERGYKFFAIALRLLRKHIDGRTAQVLALQRFHQSIDDNH